MFEVRALLECKVFSIFPHRFFCNQVSMEADGDFVACNFAFIFLYLCLIFSWDCRLVRYVACSFARKFFFKIFKVIQDPVFACFFHFGFVVRDGLSWCCLIVIAVRETNQLDFISLVLVANWVCVTTSTFLFYAVEMSLHFKAVRHSKIDLLFFCFSFFMVIQPPSIFFFSFGLFRILDAVIKLNFRVERNVLKCFVHGDCSIELVLRSRIDFLRLIPVFHFGAASGLGVTFFAIIHG